MKKKTDVAPVRVTLTMKADQRAKLKMQADGRGLKFTSYLEMALLAGAKELSKNA